MSCINTSQIIDRSTKEPLKDILARVNHVFIGTKDNFLSVPLEQRRRGLVVSFLDDTGVATYIYDASDVSDVSFNTFTNWRPFSSMVHTIDVAKDLRQSVKDLEVYIQTLRSQPESAVNEERIDAIEDAIRTLKAKVLVLETRPAPVGEAKKPDLQSIYNRLALLEADKDDNSIYDDTEIRERVSELEQRRGVQDLILNGNTLEVVGTKPKFNKTILLPTGGTTVDLTEIEARIDNVESRIDRDTTYTAGKGITIDGGKISVSYDINKKFQPIYQWMNHISKTLEALTASPEPSPEPDQPMPKPPVDEKLARKGEKVRVIITGVDGVAKTFESDLRGTIGNVSHNRVDIKAVGLVKIRIEVPLRWTLVDAGLGYMEPASLYTFTQKGEKNIYTWSGKDIFLDEDDDVYFVNLK